MAIGYIVVALIIMIINIDLVAPVFATIFKSAFSIDSTFGGLIGTAIAWGVRRGIYSNEAGMWTGAHAAAAAEVDHPVEQGLVQAFFRLYRYDYRLFRYGIYYSRLKYL